MNALSRRLNVFFYGVLAGVAIALGGVLFLLSKSFVPDGPINASQIIGSLLFPFGLLAVCVFQLNLYTGKIGMAFRNKKLDKKGLNVFEWLLWILLGNAIGAFAIGFAVFGFTQIGRDSAFSQAVASVAASRDMAFDFDGVFAMSFKSVLCGALVYVAIYFYNRLPTRFGKVAGIFVPIAFFVYAGFQHCVANMFYVAAGGVWTLNSAMGLLVCIAGNSIGALLLDLFVKW